MTAPAATRRGLRSIAVESSVETKRTFLPPLVIAGEAGEVGALAGALRAREELERRLLPQRPLEPLDRAHGDFGEGVHRGLAGLTEGDLVSRPRSRLCVPGDVGLVIDPVVLNGSSSRLMLSLAGRALSRIRASSVCTPSTSRLGHPLPTRRSRPGRRRRIRELPTE